MTRRRRQRETFADVVVELASRRRVPPTTELLPDGTHPPRGPAGIQYPVELRLLRPGEARALVAQGAALAWDGCGCSTPGCLVWFDAEERAALVRLGAPRADEDELSLWTSRDGDLVVIAGAAVQWGDLLG